MKASKSSSCRVTPSRREAPRLIRPRSPGASHYLTLVINGATFYPRAKEARNMELLEPIIGIGAAPLVIYYLTDNIKSAWKYLRDTGSVDDSPWPLMASGIGALWFVGAWLSGWLPAEANSALAAIMLGIGTGAVTSKTYEVIKR